MQKFVRILTVIVMVLACALLAAACGSDGDSSGTSDTSAKSAGGSTGSSKTGSGSDGPCSKVTDSPKQWDAPPPMAIKASDSITAQLVTSEGNIDVELMPKDAPNAVNNFVFLAREGFYTCVPFHRVIKDFMVQTGDPTGTGAGGPGYNISDDKVTKPYDRGVLAMANTGAPNSGGSQFFIVHGTTVNSTLGPTYALFGKVTNGLDVLDAIATTEVAPSDSGEMSDPVEDIWLESVKVSIAD
jgi:cyclophilin family peptidyl-prolyl cis-trans isomerase